MTGRRGRRPGLARPAPLGWRRAFTLVELLVVMSIIAMLLTLAAPRYFRSLQRSKEAVLRQDLASLRESIDKYHGDTGHYPETLAALVEKRYLRSIPVDPIARSAEKWVTVKSEDPEDEGVKDVKSGAEGAGEGGEPYATW